MNTPRNETDTEKYHRVPDGWLKNELVKFHAQMKGSYPIDSPDVLTPATHNISPERKDWLEYRETLRRIGDGIKENDAACIEIAIKYIELNYFGSYSGFIRSRLARLLKNKNLLVKQKERLRDHVQELINQKEYSEEFGELKKLIANISEKEN